MGGPAKDRRPDKTTNVTQTIKGVLVKIREVMTSNPTCCIPTDTAQQAATIMRDFNIGSIPVVEDRQSHKLFGIITDRDLCCSVLAAGLDSKITPIGTQDFF